MSTHCWKSEKDKSHECEKKRKNEIFVLNLYFVKNFFGESSRILLFLLSDHYIHSSILCHAFSVF